MTLRPERGNLAASAPLEELLTNVLRQFKRPLAAQGIQLSDAEATAIASLIANRLPLSPRAREIRDGLIVVVTESEERLAEWKLTFQQSMQTGMDEMPGWETTADFLNLANEKANAEMRISAASALVAALGDLRYAPYLLYLAEHPEADFDHILARRILSFVSRVDDKRDDWLAQVRKWIDESNE